MDIGRGILDIVLLKTWWQYSGHGDVPFSQIYHYLNLAEAGVWIVFAFFVARRYLRYKHSLLELLYAFTFFLFAATDLVEAYVLTSWLIWLKAIVLLALLWIRIYIRVRYYPTSKML